MQGDTSCDIEIEMRLEGRVADVDADVCKVFLSVVGLFYWGWRAPLTCVARVKRKRNNGASSVPLDNGASSVPLGAS